MFLVIYMATESVYYLKVERITLGVFSLSAGPPHHYLLRWTFTHPTMCQSQTDQDIKLDV